MALPKVVTPEFTTTLPSTGKKIRFRPFLVKEEKILLMAMEGNDSIEISTTVRNILKSCVLDEINVDKLPTFDIEHLFLQLRAKSVGEVVELRVRHQNPESECKGFADVTVNIDEIKITPFSRDDTKIMMNDEIGVVVHYPTINDIIDLELTNADSIMNLVVNCVDYAFDKNQIYNEFTRQEMIDFLESFNSDQFVNLIKFFDKIPKIHYDLNWTCPTCGESETIELEGLTSFFT
jgi:hypothetical protein